MQDLFDVSIIDKSLKMNFKFEDSIGYAVNRTAAIMRNSLQKAFSEVNDEITVDYWVILNRLWSRDGWIQSDLARMTHKDNASMTRMLDGMEKKGIILRRPDDSDRRANLVYLTQKGRDLEVHLKKIARANMNKAIKNLTVEEINAVKQILDKIHDNF